MSSQINLPIKLNSAHLRPIAYRVLSKKHGLHIKSSALEVLTEWIGRKFGSQWKGQESMNYLELVAKSWKSKNQASKNLFIEGDSLKEVLEELEANENKAVVDEATSLKLKDYFRVLDTSDLPIFQYDDISKRYEPGLPAKDKVSGSLILRLAVSFDIKYNLDLYISRYFQIYHQLLRTERFKWTAESYQESGHLQKLVKTNRNVKQISLIKNLLGRHSSHFVIFGLLSKNPQGNYRLQDSSGSIDLDLTNAVPDQRFFYFEGCFLVADGVYTNFAGHSKFLVNLLYHPGTETRQEFYKAFGKLDFTSNKLDIVNPALELQYQDIKQQQQVQADNYFNQRSSVLPPRIVFLGKNIPLDSLETLSHLKKLFQSLSEDLNNLPVAIVFPGSFVSVPFQVSPIDSTENSAMAYKSLFDTLAVLLLGFPELTSKTQFIFTSSYCDPWNSLQYQGSKNIPMPYGRISKIFYNRLSKVVKNLRFVTNPFKIFYLDLEILCVNDDIYQRIVENELELEFTKQAAAVESSIPVPDTDDLESVYLQSQISDIANLNINLLDKPKTVAKDIEKTVRTILHQSHVSPFLTAIRPVVWKYNNLLTLTPAPDTLVVFDSSLPFYHVKKHSSRVLNPGSFFDLDHRSINYIDYYPSIGRVEQKQMSG